VSHGVQDGKSAYDVADSKGKTAMDAYALEKAQVCVCVCMRVCVCVRMLVFVCVHVLMSI